ncbi:hypothetical protein Tco_1570730 [Tanacetum coccineum]
MYKRLDSKEGETDIYRKAKARERMKMDLGSVRFIKDDDGRSIVNEDAIRRRWKEYFSALFNGQRRDRTEEVDSIGRSSMEAIHIIRSLMEKSIESQKVMSIWEALGGKARDVGSIWEETERKRKFSSWRLPS